jgi:hypothetical protein
MKRIWNASVALVICFGFIAATSNIQGNDSPVVTIQSNSLEITSAKGVTMKYVIRGYEAKNLTGVDHGSCVSSNANPEVGKAGVIKSKGVAGTTDPKGSPAPLGTFYCAAYTNNLQSGVKYYVRPYIKLSNGTILYGAERSVTMK